MAVFSMARYRLTADARSALLSATEVAELAELEAWELQRQRIRYDLQAAGLRDYGVDPATVLGPRP